MAFSNLGTLYMPINQLFLILIRAYIGSSHHVRLSFILICNLFIMGNSLTSSNKPASKTMPIDTVFELPSPLPAGPKGGEFGSGEIDLGGLKVRQVSTFNKIWAVNEGGPDDLGATFFEPSSIPDGFSMLGSYAQANNKPQFGWVLVASDQSGDILKQPTDYTPVWNSKESLDNSANTSQDSAYFWLPTPPDGYKPVGLLVTTLPEKPQLDKIRCVRSDFTDELETDTWIWAETQTESSNGPNVYSLRPKTRGTKAQPLSVGTFILQTDANTTLSLSSLKNNNTTFSSTPNLNQVEALFQTYSPYIYFHPKETYLPSSVNWYFANGAQLYQKGEESNPTSVDPNGTNLPQGGSNDGQYWLDLPADDQAQDKIKKGDLQTSEAYLHVKPVLGATFTDIQVWIFYPFNGPATAKVGIIEKLPLGKIGEHIGDWEHITLRISNFDGILRKVYFAEHSGGTWIDSSSLEFEKGNKFVGYSSRNGHATYYKVGLVMQGAGEVGLRNDTAKSDMVMDAGERFSVVAAEGLSTAEAVVEPPWLGYAREWGPKKSYVLGNEVKKIEEVLPGNLKAAFEKMIDALPAEVYGEEGPTGPKMKNNWNGDEK